MNKIDNKKIVLIIWLLVITGFAQNNDESLVTHYKLSKEYYDKQVKGKFYDLSGNGNHAMPGDTFQFVEDHLGNADGAMRFDGQSDYLKCENGNNIDFGRDITLVFYLKPKYDLDTRPLFSKYKNDTNRFYLRIYDINKFKSKIIERGKVHEKILGPTIIDDLNYRVLSIVMKGNILKIYNNGEIVDTTFIKKDKIYNTADFYIGHLPYNSWKKYYKGSIEEVKIYAKSLNNNEIANISYKRHPHFVNWGFEEGVVTQKGQYNSLSPFRYGEDHSEKQVTIYHQNDGDIKPFKGEYCTKHTCTAGRNRAEISPIPISRIKKRITSHQHRWISWNVLIPESFDHKQESKSWICIYQNFEWHNTGGGPNYSIHALQEGFSFRASLWDKDSEGNIAHQKNFNYQTNIDLKKGTWHNIVVHIYARADTNGYFEGWIDGEPILPKELTKKFKRLLKHENESPPFEVDKGHKYQYKIRKYRLYGRNLRCDNNIGMGIQIGLYRKNNPVTNSVYVDHIKIGKTPESINFNSDNPMNKYPQLYLTNDYFNIGKAKINSTKKIQLTLSNTGEQTLDIFSCKLMNNENFRIEQYPKKIYGTRSSSLNIIFIPEKLKIYEDTLKILSNDFMNDTTLIKLQGTGAAHPKLNIKLPKK